MMSTKIAPEGAPTARPPRPTSSARPGSGIHAAIHPRILASRRVGRARWYGRKKVTSSEQNLMSKIKTLSPQQVAAVEDFVEFLAAKSKKEAALDRLLAVAPALEAANAPVPDEAEIAAEIDAARAERHARKP